jgi:hypothetical protein
MKYLSLKFIFIIFAFSPNVFGQIIDNNNPEIKLDDIVCSHQGKHFISDENKSVINPNPHVFDYDVKFYKLDIEAYDTTSQFSGSATVSAEVVIPLMNVFSIELSNKLQADSAFINGVYCMFTHSSNNISIGLQNPLPQASLFHFKLYYHTPPTYTSSYYSSTLAVNYGNFNVSQSYSEPYYAHEWMPCKQELEDKADSVHIFVTTNNDLKVAGPGLLTVVPLPNQKVRYEWRTNQKTAFYLISFAISDYIDYSIWAKPDSLPGDSILVMNYVYDYPNCLQSNKVTIDKTPLMIELFSDKMGLYPFYDEKYGHYMWYPTGFSGMEHITMTGLRSFSFNLIAHELGHSWYGDNVTCATWSDIWINEGFASYLEYIANQYLVSQASANNLMLIYMNYAMTQPGGSVYVPPANLNNSGRIFSTRLTYRKGSALVHMIRYEMQNDSLFFRTLYEFQQQYKDSVATGLDFKEVCEDVSGVDFTDFFNQWYFGEGYPIFSAIWSQVADTISLQSIQATSTTITPLFKTPVEFKFTYPGGSQTFRLYQLTNDTIFKIVIPHEVTAVTIDPNNWLLNMEGTITHRKNLNLKAYLSGPYNESTGLMSQEINPGSFPLSQPYNVSPWNYAGTETIPQIPSASILDWVLIELRDAPTAGQATKATIINQQAGFILNDGSIVGLDGSSFLQFDNLISNQMFIVIHHRNHLSIMSANSQVYENGVYSYDFSNAAEQIYGGASGSQFLDLGIWGMIAGDADGNGIVEQSDKTTFWESRAGKQGYLSSDLNLDGQADNLDKDDFWLPNLGKVSAILE